MSINEGHCPDCDKTSQYVGTFIEYKDLPGLVKFYDEFVCLPCGLSFDIYLGEKEML